MIFFYGPEENAMDITQRIFYVHIASAGIAVLAFFLIIIGSIGNFISKKPVWRFLASASAEIGMLFCTFALLTGLLWTKPTENAWWKWNWGFTSLLLLWCLYLIYTILRYTVPQERNALYTSLFTLVVCITLLLIYVIIQWRQMPPLIPISIRDIGSGFPPETQATLQVSLVAFLCLFAYLLQQRIVLAHMQHEIDKIRRSIAEHHIQYGFLVEDQNFIIEEYNFEEYKHHE